VVVAVVLLLYLCWCNHGVCVAVASLSVSYSRVCRLAFDKQILLLWSMLDKLFEMRNCASTVTLSPISAAFSYS
jgi:hypothetical protein